MIKVNKVVIQWNKFYEILEYGNSSENFDHQVNDIFDLSEFDELDELDDNGLKFYQDDDIFDLNDETKSYLIEFLSQRLKEYQPSDIIVTKNGSCLKFETPTTSSTPTPSFSSLSSTSSHSFHATKILSPLDHPDQENFRFLVKGNDWFIFVQLIGNHPSVFVNNIPNVGSFVYENSNGSSCLPFNEPYLINDIKMLDRLVILLREFIFNPTF